MKLLNLPNIITCGNVISGSMAIFFGLHGELDLACLCIILGAVFDFFDGMTARALHISGPIGKELDSLADMISFGLAPTVLAYQIGASFDVSWNSGLGFLLCCPIAAFSALRLAKFNCDERQSLSFVGLPTPANALFWIGMTYVARMSTVQGFILNNMFACGFAFEILVIAMSVLLISELPMFSLKIKPGHMGFAENKIRYCFLAATVAVLIGTAFAGRVGASLAFIILLYIVASVIDNATSK